MRTAPHRWRAPLVTAWVAAAAVVAVALRDPHEPGSWGRCPILLLTGHPCPGCGGLRAVHELTHGRLVQALGSNVLAVAAVLVGGALLVRWFWRRASCPRAPLASPRARTGWSVVLLVMAFGGVRLIPGFGWLGP